MSTSSENHTVDIWTRLPDVMAIVSIGFCIFLRAVPALLLGVPFLLAFLGQNEIVVGSALSLISGLGDLMPPTALAGIFAAQVVGEKNYFKVLKYTIIPAIATAIWGIGMIIFANELGKLL